MARSNLVTTLLPSRTTTCSSRCSPKWSHTILASSLISVSLGESARLLDAASAEVSHRWHTVPLLA
ncbi:hypothetical protein IA203_01145 [Corynebacterium wankanglinii]|nr:hypothetical protein IA203_01145 [Corynebacterium wankanglinii]